MGNVNIDNNKLYEDIIDISKPVNELHRQYGYPKKSIAKLCVALANDGIEPDYTTVRDFFSEAVHKRVSLNVLIAAYKLAQSDLEQKEFYFDPLGFNKRILNLTANYLVLYNTK